MRWRTVVYVALVVVVLAAHAAIVAPEFWLTRLWEDEAYNLTVPLNLLAGHGYTSDGILTPSGMLTPFDVRISTGPTVLLPVAAVLATGADLVVGARFVLLLYYAALLAGLWLIGRRIGGRWGALVALAVPIALNTNQLPSPAQGPLDVLGEFPSAAFIVFAFLFVRKRPWLGGLMLGLAVQTKFIAALALPGLLLMAWLAVAAAPARQRWRRVIWVAVWAAIPSVAYELAILVTLGWSGFKANVHAFLAFVRSGGQIGVHASATDKFWTLVDSWYAPPWLVFLTIVFAVAVGAAVCIMLGGMRASERAELVTRSGADADAREVSVLLAALGVTFVLWNTWWFVSSRNPMWIRYPTPMLLVCVPAFGAALVLGCRMLWLQSSTGLAARRSIAAPAVIVLVITMAVQLYGHIPSAYRPNLGETLIQQRAAAAAIARLRQPVLAAPWGPQIGVIVLSGARAEPSYARRGATPMVYSAFGGGTPAALDKLAQTCGTRLLQTGNYLVCRPASG